MPVYTHGRNDAQFKGDLSCAVRHDRLDALAVGKDEKPIPCAYRACACPFHSAVPLTQWDNGRIQLDPVPASVPRHRARVHQIYFLSVWWTCSGRTYHESHSVHGTYGSYAAHSKTWF